MLKSIFVSTVLLGVSLVANVQADQPFFRNPIVGTPAAGTTKSPIDKAGRLFGVGWGDGYHACASSGYRCLADLPPADFATIRRREILSESIEEWMRAPQGQCEVLPSGYRSLARRSSCETCQTQTSQSVPWMQSEPTIASSIQSFDAPTTSKPPADKPDRPMQRLGELDQADEEPVSPSDRNASGLLRDQVRNRRRSPIKARPTRLPVVRDETPTRVSPIGRVATRPDAEYDDGTGTLRINPFVR
ncbi:MAG: hypothetical protein AAF664_08595 [Planctomycetota bacterium]